MNRVRELLSNEAERRVEELHDDNHRRRELEPLDELELMDARAEAAGQDEWDTMWDPDTHPRGHRVEDPDEPVADSDGVIRDLMLDTPPVEELTLGPDPTEEHGDLVGDNDPIEVDLGIDL